MKQWMTTLAAAILTLSVAMPLAAQNEAKPGEKPAAKGAKGAAKGKRHGRFAAALGKLNLTADQKSKIDAIVKDQRAEAKSLKGSGAAPDELKKKRRDLNKQTMGKILAVLTPDQQQQFKDELKKGRAKGAANKGKNGAAGTGAGK